MFKKINHKLLSQFPLLWNIKIFVFLPAALLIHLLFYLAGFVYPISITQLADYKLFQFGDITLFSVLVSVLLIIFWLVYFLRNNPFKSYYTLSKKYIFGEFLLLFIVFLSSSTFFLTYQQGFYHNVRIVTKDVDLKQEADIFNLSFHFIAYNEKDFDTRYRCDSVAIREQRDSIWEANHPYNNQKNNNSITNDEYLEDTPHTRPQEGYLSDDSTNYPLSYLNYCTSNKVNLYAENGKEMDKEALNMIAERWLKEYKKDSVLYVLIAMKNLCIQYGIINKFNPQKQLLECFNDSLFSIQNIYHNAYNDNSYDNSYSDPYVTSNDIEHYESRDYYMNTHSLESSLDRIDQVRYGFWNEKILFFMLYYALGMSLFLFSFRISRLKNWFISIVASGILTILISLFAVFNNFNEGTSLINLLLFLWIIFLISGISMIKNKQNKLISSVLFQWSFWFLSFVIPFVFILINDYTDIDCYQYIDAYKVCPDPPFINTWIDSNWTIIHCINFIFILICIYFIFIPLSRKWQSNPEE